MVIMKNKLLESSYHALQEANRWKHIAKSIDDKNNLCREYGVILSYASELYLKCILMFNGIKCTGHNLYALYNQLPNNIKDIFKSKYNLDTIIKKDFFTEKLVGTYTGFEEGIKLVSYDFVDLRYIYEKYDMGKIVYVANEVHLEINNILEEYSRSLTFNWDD